jgi:hypothetical protein
MINFTGDEELVRIDTRSNSDVITFYQGLTPDKLDISISNPQIR